MSSSLKNFLSWNIKNHKMKTKNCLPSNSSFSLSSFSIKNIRSPNQKYFSSLASLSPAVAWHVRANNIDISSIIGTGPRGRILKGDILLALDNKTAKFINNQNLHSNNSNTIQPLSNKQTIHQANNSNNPNASPNPNPNSNSNSIGRSRSRGFVDLEFGSVKSSSFSFLSSSGKAVPHAYTSMALQINLNFLKPLIKQAENEKESEKKTNENSSSLLNYFILRQIAKAIKQLPFINKSLGVDILYLSEVGSKLIKNSEKKNSFDIQNQPFEVVPSSSALYCVSSISASDARPVVLPGQLISIAISNPSNQPYPLIDPKTNVLSFKEQETVSLGMAFDQRIMDDAQAAEFLERIKRSVEQPF